MLISIVWDNKRIPNDEPYKAIDELGLAPIDAEHLWSLWCALDAILDEQDIANYDDAEPERVSALLNSCPEFIEGANETETENDSDYDWSGLPGWVLHNSDKLRFAA